MAIQNVAAQNVQKKSAADDLVSPAELRLQGLRKQPQAVRLREPMRRTGVVGRNDRVRETPEDHQVDGRGGVKPTTVPDLQVIQRLQSRINGVESAGRIDSGQVVSAGCAAIDRLLPEGGYPKGALIQWLGHEGLGAGYLALLAAKAACAEGGALVVIDPDGQFFPPAAAAIGINMSNLIVLRSTSQNDLFWSVDQALRCSAVGAVWGPMGTIDERWFRRFQLSAEASGCLGLFLQSAREARLPSWAEIQWLLGPPRRSGTGLNIAPTSDRRASQQRVRLQLTRCRGTRTGKAIEVTIDAVTGSVAEAR